MKIYEIDGVKYTTINEFKRLLGNDARFISFGYNRLSRRRKLDTTNQPLISETIEKHYGTDFWKKLELYKFEQIISFLKSSDLAYRRHIEEICEAFGEEIPKDGYIPEKGEVFFIKLKTIFKDIVNIEYKYLIGEYKVDYLLMEYKIVIDMEDFGCNSTEETIFNMGKDVFLNSKGYKVLRLDKNEDKDVLINTILKEVVKR